MRKTGFLIHCLGDGDVNFLAIFEICADFIAEVTFGDFNVVFRRTIRGQQVKEVIVDVDLLSAIVG